jgi:hypothetical protein
VAKVNPSMDQKIMTPTFGIGNKQLIGFSEIRNNSYGSILLEIENFGGTHSEV